MTSIIQLTGGFMRTCALNGLKYVCTNIHFYKSDYWTHAIIKVNNIHLSMIESNITNGIKLEVIDNTPSLLVNEMIVWQQKNIFNYNVTLHLNNKFPDTPYNMIFKYYWKPHIISIPL